MLKKYKLQEVIGSGTYGNVYKATFMNNIVAVKVIDIQKIADNEHITEKKIIQRIDREVKILKMIDHPYIVKLEDSFIKDNNYYIIMEYIPGIELLDKYGIKEKKVKKYFKQICIAVRYCHSHDPPIVHRDLKLENILVDDSDNIKIIDFGFANLQKSEKLDSLCGTLEYIPPELFEGQGYQGKPFDIWSLGIILFTIVSGKFPYQNDSKGNIYLNNAKLNDCICSDSCKKLILRILVLDPKLRPTIEEILLDPWFMSKKQKKENLKKITKVYTLKKNNSEPENLTSKFSRNIHRRISQIE